MKVSCKVSIPRPRTPTLDNTRHPRHKRGPSVIHPVCSVRRMDIEEKLARVVAAFAESVERPISAGCCGFAGDRGFRYPELPRAAMRGEAEEVRRRWYDGYYSSSRSCEIGLAMTTGQPYRSFWHLLEETTR